jgi:hypothetical protein
MSTARQRLGKHIPAATDNKGNNRELLEMVFSMWPVPTEFWYRKIWVMGSVWPETKNDYTGEGQQKLT